MTWQDDAACQGMGPELFYPSSWGWTPTEGLAVCAGCEVRAECAEAGRSEPCGIWGGVYLGTGNHRHEGEAWRRVCRCCGTEWEQAKTFRGRPLLYCSDECREVARRETYRMSKIRARAS